MMDNYSKTAGGSTVSLLVRFCIIMIDDKDMSQIRVASFGRFRGIPRLGGGMIIIDDNRTLVLMVVKLGRQCLVY